MTQSPQIRIQQLESESSITTKTFVAEHIFIETEFLPTKSRLFTRESQVNILIS